MTIDIPARPIGSLVSRLPGHETLVRIQPAVNRREALAVVLVSLILVAVTLVPDFLGFEFARPGTQFMGALMNPEDTNSYLAKMEQGYEGAWLYAVPFTSEAHSPAFIGGFYLLLGHAARLANISLLEMWYVARVVFTLLMFVTTFGFIRHFLPEARPHWIAYLLALTGSGLGWLLLVAGQTNWLGDFPVDFKMPEAHLFFSALTFPHFVAGIALILGSLWMSFRLFETDSIFLALGAGVLNLALAIVYPFMIYLIAGVLALKWIDACLSARHVCIRPGIGAAISMLLPLPLLIYYYVVLRTNVVFAAWDAQAVTLSPNALHYLIAYGAMLLFAAPTLRDAKLRPLWLWVLAAAVLVYAPLNSQRRFVEGVQVPLAILAAAGLVTYYLPRLRENRLFRRLASRPHYSPEGLERLVVVGLVVVMAVSNLYVLLSMSVTAAVLQPYPFFRPQAEVEAIDWAGAHLPAGAVVMSGYETGSLIPTRTGLKTVIGHWAETKDFAQKYADVNRFFDPTTPDGWRSGFLEAQHVGYIFYGDQGQKVSRNSLVGSRNLTQIFENSRVIIYRVNQQ